MDGNFICLLVASWRPVQEIYYKRKIMLKLCGNVKFDNANFLDEWHDIIIKLYQMNVPIEEGALENGFERLFASANANLQNYLQRSSDAARMHNVRILTGLINQLLDNQLKYSEELKAQEITPADLEKLKAQLIKETVTALAALKDHDEMAIYLERLRLVAEDPMYQLNIANRCRLSAMKRKAIEDLMRSHYRRESEDLRISLSKSIKNICKKGHEEDMDESEDEQNVEYAKLEKWWRDGETVPPGLNDQELKTYYDMAESYRKQNNFPQFVIDTGIVPHRVMNPFELEEMYKLNKQANSIDEKDEDESEVEVYELSNYGEIYHGNSMLEGPVVPRDQEIFSFVFPQTPAWADDDFISIVRSKDLPRLKEIRKQMKDIVARVLSPVIDTTNKNNTVLLDNIEKWVSNKCKKFVTKQEESDLELKEDEDYGLCNNLLHLARLTDFGVGRLKFDKLDSQTLDQLKRDIQSQIDDTSRLAWFVP